MKYIFFENPKALINGETFELMQLEHHILLQRRKELNMTQQQVADRSGILLRQYQRFESGERNISSSSGRIMLTVCDALKLDPYLFLGKGNEPDETKYIVLPPITKQGLQYAIPSHAYYLLVSAIPRGKVCTNDDIMHCLRSAYGSDTLEVKTEVNGVEMYINESFPFWRVVSQRGFLVNSFYISKETQREMLKAEGIEVHQNGDKDSYRIKDFQYNKFDINSCKISVIAAK